MNGPRRPRQALCDEEGWVDALVGAAAWLRRRAAIVEDAAEVATENRWAESDLLVDALVGLVALSRRMGGAVTVLEGDAAEPQPPHPTEPPHQAPPGDLLR